jgi:glycerol kinase
VVRATVDGIAAQVALLARAAATDLGRPLTRLKVDGGLTASPFLCQTQADLLQLPVEVAPSVHATALGVAALARIGTGEVSGLEEAIGEFAPLAVYEPAISPAEAAERLGRFETTVARMLAADGRSAS